MSELKTQPNEKRCRWTESTHMLPIHGCCPMTGNPLEGSKVFIHYVANDSFLEVISLRAYVDSYIGGKGPIRSMEGMIQEIAQDCADAVQTNVHVRAELILFPNQQDVIKCSANRRS